MASSVATDGSHQLLRLRVNGVDRAMAVRPTDTLLDVLRNRLRLTGTKAGCEMGNCGACTVLLDDLAVYSCLTLAVECDDVEVATIESLADDGDLAPLQQAFVDCDGLQCGFCTSGQIISLEALRRGGEPTTAAIRQAVAGNLCRCGAYQHIIEAAEQALVSK